MILMGRVSLVPLASVCSISGFEVWSQRLISRSLSRFTFGLTQAKLEGKIKQGVCKRARCVRFRPGDEPACDWCYGRLSRLSVWSSTVTERHTVSREIPFESQRSSSNNILSDTSLPVSVEICVYWKKSTNDNMNIISDECWCDNEVVLFTVCVNPRYFVTARSLPVSLVMQMSLSHVCKRPSVCSSLAECENFNVVWALSASLPASLIRPPQQQ